ncbi:MAG: sulfite exporter TauE/SafE family protein [Sedimentisphaerales bacterium]|nr:sulfite exporter TauE/SafE family protein [Sedimentisphaerales bacterium]
MTNILLYILLGLTAGILSGLIGIGGATIIIPVLVFIFGMNQHLAQGTTLALMVPPIGILAAWTYYQKGFVDFKIAALVCIGFFIGGLIGAKLAVGIPEQILKKMFGIFLLAVSLRMIFFK